MLPALNVKSLVTVADDQYTSHALRHRERLRESQTDRDLSGFYVYQNYLKRLRRLHRNYVKKYQEATSEIRDGRHAHNPQQKHSLLPHSHLKTEFSHSVAPREGSSSQDWPATRFRISAPGAGRDEAPTANRGGRWINQSGHSSPSGKIHQSGHSSPSGKIHQSGHSSSSEKIHQSGHSFSPGNIHQPGHSSSMSSPTLPPISTTQHKNATMEILGGIANMRMGDNETAEEDEEEEGGGGGGGDGGRGDEAIYIPCGRENSALHLQRARTRLRHSQGRDRSGALCFRLWRGTQGLANTPYST